MENGRKHFYAMRRGRRPDPNDEEHMPHRLELGPHGLVVPLQTLKMAKALLIGGEGSCNSRAFNSETEHEVVPKLDQTEFVYIEDMEQMLIRTCGQLQFISHTRVQASLPTDDCRLLQKAKLEKTLLL
ncbi:hypothetical protein AHAS_Ahas05G0082200 [Arachis hypogaea]